MARLAVGWSLLAELIPIYALYALFFADTGLSDAEISSLFVIWSVSGFLFEIPSGALADRFSRKNCLVAAGVIQACGYVFWTGAPGYTGFAVGFVLWSLGGSFVTGAFEALLYDGLAAAGAQGSYQRVYSWTRSAGLIAQLPVALLATVLFALGGYQLAGWVSVGMCLAAAALATRFTEPPRTLDADSEVGDDGDDADADESGYLQTLRAGLTESMRPAVRGVLVIAAALGGFDAVEEYFSLLAQDWGLSVTAIPIALLGIPIAGAIGAMAGGRSGRLSSAVLGTLLVAAMTAFGVAGLIGKPVAIVGVAVFYGLYRWVLVIADARLQDRISGRARATVTSVASLAVEAFGLLLFLAWAAGGVALTVAAGLVLASAVPRWLPGAFDRPDSAAG